jgi:hypothetical protein
MPSTFYEKGFFSFVSYLFTAKCDKDCSFGYLCVCFHSLKITEDDEKDEGSYLLIRYP